MPHTHRTPAPHEMRTAVRALFQRHGDTARAYSIAQSWANAWAKSGQPALVFAIMQEANEIRQD